MATFYDGAAWLAKFEYRVSRGMVVPYLKYALPKVAGHKNPIIDVVLDPKCVTHERVVEMMLRQFGLKFDPWRSTATYR